MNNKVDLDFLYISNALKRLKFPSIDLIIGIAEGGVVPASLIAHQLNLPMHIIRINYRDADNTPQRKMPELLQLPPKLPARSNILLVDDVSVSGQTLSLAKGFFEGNNVTTLTLKGAADIVLFPQITDCVNWPWKS